MRKAETDLADATRQLLKVLGKNTCHLSPEGGAACIGVVSALADFAAQEQDRKDFRSRLTDEKLDAILQEEYRRVGSTIDWALHLKHEARVIDAAMGGMRRVADYADHLRGMIVKLMANADPMAIIYQVREAEQEGWDGPKVKAVGEAVAEMEAEAKAGPADG